MTLKRVRRSALPCPPPSVFYITSDMFEPAGSRVYCWHVVVLLLRKTRVNIDHGGSEPRVRGLGRRHRNLSSGHHRATVCKLNAHSCPLLIFSRVAVARSGVLCCWADFYLLYIFFVNHMLYTWLVIIIQVFFFPIFYYLH